MTTITLPAFAADQPAARVDVSLRQALNACDRARECAVLWFAEVQRRSLHRELGCASLHIYAAPALGFSDNRYWQFKRLADDLSRLPALHEAVATGELGWTKAQQVARVATTETQVAWVARARTSSRRALVADAAGAIAQGTAVQVVVQQCPTCEAATVVTGRGEKRLAPAQVAALACDARVRWKGKRSRATVPPSARAAVLARDRHRCTTPGCGSARYLEVHHLVPRARGGTNRVENLITLCSRCHQFAHDHPPLAQVDSIASKQPL